MNVKVTYHTTRSTQHSVFNNVKEFYVDAANNLIVDDEDGYRRAHFAQGCWTCATKKTDGDQD